MIAHPDRFVDEFLDDNERVLFRSPPDIGAWAAVQVVDYVAAGFVLWLMWWAESSVVMWGGLIALGIIVGQYVWRALTVWYTRYVLTSHRALRVSGVFRTDCEWMTWSKVTDVSVHRGIADRLLHTATIYIRSANEASTFRAMSDVPDALSFAGTITTLVTTRQGKG